MSRHRLDAEADAAPVSLIDAELRVPCGEAVRLAVGIGLLVAILTGIVISRAQDKIAVVILRALVWGGSVGAFSYVALFGLFVADERRDRKRARPQPVEPDVSRVEVGVSSEPVRQLVTLRLDEGTTSRYIHDIPMSDGLRRFARGVAGGMVAFSERGAADCGIVREEFLALRDQLLERGVIAWKNADSPRAGYTFGRGFERAMQALSEMEVG